MIEMDLVEIGKKGAAISFAVLLFMLVLLNVIVPLSGESAIIWLIWLGSIAVIAKVSLIVFLVMFVLGLILDRRN